MKNREVMKITQLDSNFEWHRLKTAHSLRMKKEKWNIWFLNIFGEIDCKNERL